ncbi:MAG: hypothetical protein LUC34_07320 [Campylobacter sp.]|nr:hypothetical protein [Campylobacter sp.]
MLLRAKRAYEMNCVDMQFFESELSMDDERVCNLLSKILRNFEIKYGIGYQFEGRLTTAYLHIFGNGSEFYGYDNSLEWQGSLRDAAEAGFARKLRMAYRANILNGEHLKLDISGQSLQEWIGANASNGSLKRVNENWIRRFDGSQIDRVNQVIGAASALISWDPPVPKPRRRLP